MNNKAFKYMGVVLGIVVVFTTIACYKFLKSDNEVGPNLITAFVGVAISAVVTLVLLNGQTKDEERKERNINLYNAKLKVYSLFVSSWYKAYSDNEITKDELSDLRTVLFGKVFFYVENKDAFEEIEKKLSSLIETNAEIDANDPKMKKFFEEVVSILQKDLNGLPIVKEKTFLKNFISLLKELFSKQRKEIKNDDHKRRGMIWRYFDQILENTKDEEKQCEDIEKIDSVQPNDTTIQVEDSQNNTCNTPMEESTNEPKRLEQQSWHFIMWGDEQLTKIKEGFNELSLVEYGEYWRTNLVKQVQQGDIIMLFRRGGSGYIGAYKAIGTRIFDFEKEEERIVIFGNDAESKIITKENDKDVYESDIKEYDIYGSCDDGATSCANIIVEEIAFKENGVKNPGGVYRRTISRYDSHYAWLLMERFKKAGVLNDFEFEKLD